MGQLLDNRCVSRTLYAHANLNQTAFDGTHASLAAHIAAHIANHAMAIGGAGQAIDVTGQITGEMAFADWGALPSGSSWEPELSWLASIK